VKSFMICADLRECVDDIRVAAAGDDVTRAVNAKLVVSKSSPKNDRVDAGKSVHAPGSSRK